jgi:hypothetical protein
MKILKTLAIISLLMITSCSVDPGANVKSVPSLISEKFTSDTEYEIVCIGYPKEGLTGIQKEESAKRAALLNAYFFSKNRFDDTVSPDQDGNAEKFTMFEDHAELKYVIKKSNLKKRLKK